MKLQQLQYIVEVVDQNLNVSSAAEKLDIFQSGISKQIAHLEDELGVKIYERNGRNLSKLTGPGAEIVNLAREILLRVNSIQSVAEDYTHPTKGSLRISTTYTQARYVLPEKIKGFKERYPNVSLHMHQATPQQMANAINKGEIDCVIATEALDLFNNSIMLPCYRWNRSLVVLKDHPLAQLQHVTLEDLAQYNLVTYVFAFMHNSDLDNAFKESSLTPNVVFTATDTDIIKTYVRIGMGVGIIATLAIDPLTDSDLVVIDASHLFKESQTTIVLSNGIYLRDYMYDFIESFSSHLVKEVVDHAVQLKNNKQREAYFQSFGF